MTSGNVKKIFSGTWKQPPPSGRAATPAGRPPYLGNLSVIQISNRTARINLISASDLGAALRPALERRYRPCRQTRAPVVGEDVALQRRDARSQHSGLSASAACCFLTSWPWWRGVRACLGVTTVTPIDFGVQPMYGTPVNVSRSVQFWFLCCVTCPFLCQCCFAVHSEDGRSRFNCTCSHSNRVLLVCDTEGLTRRSSRNDFIACKQFISFLRSFLAGWRR